ncbi:uncharacterized protein LOC117117652 [Anneissia japonica]|uniref:uncharacterized protein LOC117117652 n=1 Tax=Anneissia japonica TaxID=1529436 RepID=UPI0014258E9A|nr:uncharacterized protein LOC117117652 [Anneissia japonica]
MDEKKNVVRVYTPTLMRGLTSATAVAVAPFKFRLRMDYHGTDSSVSLWNNLKAWIKQHPLYSGCLAVLCGVNIVPIISFAAAYITIKITMKVGRGLLQGVRRLLGFQTKSTIFEDEYHLSHVNQQMSEYWGRFRIVPTTRTTKKVVSLYNDVADFKMLEECTRLLQTSENGQVYSYLTGICDGESGDVDSAIPSSEIEKNDLEVTDQYATDHPDIIRGLDAKQMFTSDILPTDASLCDEVDGKLSLEVESPSMLALEESTKLEQKLSRDDINEVKNKKKRRKIKRISWPFTKKK